MPAISARLPPAWACRLPCLVPRLVPRLVPCLVPRLVPCPVPRPAPFRVSPSQPGGRQNCQQRTVPDRPAAQWSKLALAAEAVLPGCPRAAEHIAQTPGQPAAMQRRLSCQSDLSSYISSLLRSYLYLLHETVSQFPLRLSAPQATVRLSAATGGSNARRGEACCR